MRHSSFPWHDAMLTLSFQSPHRWGDVMVSLNWDKMGLLKKNGNEDGGGGKEYTDKWFRSSLLRGFMCLEKMTWCRGVVWISPIIHQCMRNILGIRFMIEKWTKECVLPFGFETNQSSFHGRWKNIEAVWLKQGVQQCWGCHNCRFHLTFGQYKDKARKMDLCTRHRTHIIDQPNEVFYTLLSIWFESI